MKCFYNLACVLLAPMNDRRLALLKSLNMRLGNIVPRLLTEIGAFLVYSFRYVLLGTFLSVLLYFFPRISVHVCVCVCVCVLIPNLEMLSAFLL